MPINLLNSIKEVAESVISNHPDVPEDKKGLAVETVTSAIASGLKDFATPDKLAGLTSLLTGGGGGNILQGIENSVVSALSGQIGLNPSVASGITSSILPMITNLLSNKSAEGINIGSLLSGLGGLGGGGLQGLFGAVKGLFGGNN